MATLESELKNYVAAREGKATTLRGAYTAIGEAEAAAKFMRRIQRAVPD